MGPEPRARRQGVLALHSHKPPILHRDLKSPNLLIDKHWRCKIADFNLSRVMVCAEQLCLPAAVDSRHQQCVWRLSCRFERILRHLHRGAELAARQCRVEQVIMHGNP